MLKAIRISFFVLLFGNLLLFAYGRGYLGGAGGGGEADRLAAQMEPDRLRVVAVGAPPATAAAPPPEACRALEGLSAEQAQALAALLQGRDGQLKISQRPLEEPSAWWVYLPAQANGQGAEKKAAELKKLGVEEFFVVQEAGPHQHAVSLGLFKSAQGAKDRLEALQKQGVRSARIEVRHAPTGKLALEVRGVSERLTPVLAELPAEFAAATAADCVVARP